MKLPTRSSLQALVLGLALSCSLPSLANEAEQGAGPLLVYMGGNNSCGRETLRRDGPKGMDVYQSYIRPLINEFQNDIGHPLAWLISCYQGHNIYYYSSQAPNELKVVPELVQDKIFLAIKDLAHRTKAKSVVMVGHSHGGWLAMQGALSWMRALHLTTIDPISRRLCTIERPSQCTVFPPDVTQAQRHILRRLTQSWHQYYQEETIFLHSSPVAEADHNAKLPHSHKEIRNDASLWEDVRHQVYGRPPYGEPTF